MAETSHKMSPATPSPVFPERLIYPLPKRRLRERLPPGVASTIQYPPASTAQYPPAGTAQYPPAGTAQYPPAGTIQYAPGLTTGTPLFYYPVNVQNDGTPSSEQTIAANRAHAAVQMARYNEAVRAASSMQPTQSSAPAVVPGTQPVTQPGTQPGTQLAAGQTILLPFHPRQRVALPDASNAARVAHLVHQATWANPTWVSQHVRSAPVLGYQPPPPTIPSLDSYEYFENAKNKKKRKIPTAGDTPLGGRHISTDLHSATSVASSSAAKSNNDSGISDPLPANHSETASFAPVPSGLSGPGRGHYGRTRGDRGPLHAIADTDSNYAGRDEKLPSSCPTPSENNSMLSTPPQGKNGIITSAIANAEMRAPRVQENGQGDHGNERPAIPTPPQFIFTFSSQAPGNLTWPGSEPKQPSSSLYSSDLRRSGVGHESFAVAGADDGSIAGSSGGIRAQQEEKKKRSSKIRQELKAQIRERRRAQQERNAANPQMDDFYVCPFCDYEIITGRKSKLVIRFELKERKRRLEAERRQRERAKDRSRNKGRKDRKTTVPNADASAQPEMADEEQQYDGAVADDPEAGELEDEVHGDDDDEAGEADDVVPELRSGIGDTHTQRSRGRDAEGGRLRDDAG